MHPSGIQPLWGETAAGSVIEDASVEGVRCAAFDLICRTAVYVTRLYGGVGGAVPEVPSKGV